MIPKETIQNIIETARVEEVISDFVNLQKRGVNYVARCPFHDEKTPSFVVSPSKGIYKCFGCGKAGNAVNFVMEHEHFSYPEALKYIARKYNIEVEEEEQTPEQTEEENRREILYNIHDFAAKFFTEQLFDSQEGKTIALPYFKERDFDIQTIREFHLGYAPQKRDTFYQYALARGYKKEYLVESGLVIEKNNSFFDRFAGRVLFPIHSLSGRVIGFGGRIMGSDKKTAKYLNSPETLIYSKSKVLYGMYFAKNEVIKQDRCYLVEGYTDVISLHQTGIKNVVASSGTSLTEGQIRLIQRYTKNITILYDGDPAGIKASFRGIDMILSQGMNVRILLFPEGEDPDSFARSHRSSETLEFLKNNTEDFIEFKTRVLMEEAKKDPVKKAGLVKDIVQSVSVIPDAIVREVYIKECAVLLEMSEEVLVRELNHILRKRFKKKYQASTYLPPPGEEKALPQHITSSFTEREEQEKDILRLLFSYPDHELVFEKKSPDERSKDDTVTVPLQQFILSNLWQYSITFENPQYRKILKMLLESFEKGEKIDPQYYINFPDKEINNIVINLIMNKYDISSNWKERGNIIVIREEDNLKKAAEQAILALGEKILKKEIEEKKRALKEADAEEEEHLLKELMELEEKWRTMYQQLGRILAP